MLRFNEFQVPSTDIYGELPANVWSVRGKRIDIVAYSCKRNHGGNHQGQR